MTSWIQAHRRLLMSARILKAYYESKLKMDVELLTEAPKPQLDSDVGFSPSIAGFGVWGLRPSQPISVELHAEIGQMCEEILAGLESMETKREALEKLQLQMERALNGEMPSNVISLRRKNPTRSTPAFNSDRVYVLKSDCLIESRSLSEIHKMAMELHAYSNRMAFVEFGNLDVNQRQSISQLMDLGAITLFIPNVLHLTSLEQEMFRHLIQQNVLERPLLMVGTVMPYSDLLGKASLDDQLLTLLARSYIKLTRPFSEYKEQALIHYFLDSLSSNPT